MKFSCVGFEIKAWPWSGSLNADDTGWDIHERRRDEIKERFALSVNEYHLLEIRDQALMDAVCDWVAEKNDCQIAAIHFPLAAVQLSDERRGCTTSDIVLSFPRFVCVGIDVCDFDGLFSALHAPRLAASPDLFGEHEIEKALEFALVANVFDRSHSPFVVAKVSILVK